MWGRLVQIQSCRYWVWEKLVQIHSCRYWVWGKLVVQRRLGGHQHRWGGHQSVWGTGYVSGGACMWGLCLAGQIAVLAQCWAAVVLLRAT